MRCRAPDPLHPTEGADLAKDVARRRIAILATDGVERVELDEPRRAVLDAGATVDLLSVHDGEIAARNHDVEDAGTIAVDRLVGEVSVDDYAGLILPGGVGNRTCASFRAARLG